MPTGIVKKVKTKPTYQTGKVTEDGTTEVHKFYQDLSINPPVKVDDHVSYTLIEFDLTDIKEIALGEKVAVDLEED